MLLYVCHDLIELAECKSYIAVGTTIVNSDLSALGIMKRSARETYIGYETSLLIPLSGCKKEVFASVKHLGGILKIQDSAADGINVTVAST